MLRLKELRKEKGVLQKDVASYLGVDRSTYVRYENGQSNPDIDTLTMLSRYFDVSIDYLVGRSDNKTAAPFENLKYVSFDILENTTADNNISTNKVSEQFLLMIYGRLDEQDKLILWNEAVKLIIQDKYNELPPVLEIAVNKRDKKQ